MFLDRLSKQYSYLLRISPLYLYFLSIVCIASIVSLWWFFVFQKQNSSLEHVRASINQGYAQWSILKKSELEVNVLQKSIADLKNDIQRIAKKNKVLSDTILTDINGHAIKQNITLDLCQFADQNSHHELSFVAHGSMDNLIKFLGQLYSDQIIASLIKIDLQMAKDSEYALQATASL